MSTTMASVTELEGKDNDPEILKLVEVALVATKFVVVTIVPEATVKMSGPDNVPPVNNR